MSQPSVIGHQWTAEVTVDEALAAGLIREQFPGLDAEPVTELETGWDNTAFLAGDRWLFRFPRRAIALPGVRREIDVLPRLAPRLPLPIPAPELIGSPSASFGWPFWGARLLPGRELAQSGLPDAERGRVGARIGRFLRALHDPGLVAEFGTGLVVDPMGRGVPSVRAPKARASLDRLAAAAAWLGDAAVDALLDQARAVPPEKPTSFQNGVPPAPVPPAALVLSHGDLHVRHVLVGDDGEASGVIDWGDLCLADPAVDLSIAYGGFVGSARDELLAAYGPVGPERELAARTCALSVFAALAEYAAAEGRSGLLAESVAGLHRAVS